MDANAQIEFCKFVLQTNGNAFQERKKHGRRIVYSVLTFYVLVGALKVRKGVVLPGSAWVWGCHLLLAFITIVFLKFIHTANNTDKSIAHNAEHAMQDMLKSSEPCQRT